MYAGVAEVHATNDYKLILIFDNKERDSMAEVQDTTIRNVRTTDDSLFVEGRDTR